MNSALKAHFGRAPGLGFGRTAADFVQIEPIGGPPKRSRTSLGESAEAAVIEADVRVIDIAIDRVGHRIADVGFAQ